MSAGDVATLASIVGYLERGTGDPGLTFEDYNNTVTQIIQLREDNFSHLWAVLPVTVINSVDGPHTGCALFITFYEDEDEDIHVVFGAIDRMGEPCAWQVT